MDLTMASDSSTTSYEQQMRDIEEPLGTDVLFGRGEATAKGNKRFGKLVRLNVVSHECHGNIPDSLNVIRSFVYT
jgi:hypothetical protein